jgi:hypothetical protein
MHCKTSPAHPAALAAHLQLVALVLAAAARPAAAAARAAAAERRRHLALELVGRDDGLEQRADVGRDDVLAVRQDALEGGLVWGGIASKPVRRREQARQAACASQRRRALSGPCGPQPGARTLVILQNVRHSVCGTRHAAGNRPQIWGRDKWGPGAGRGGGGSEPEAFLTAARPPSPAEDPPAPPPAPRPHLLALLQARLEPSEAPLKAVQLGGVACGRGVGGGGWDQGGERGAAGGAPPSRMPLQCPGGPRAHPASRSPPPNPNPTPPRGPPSPLMLKMVWYTVISRSHSQSMRPSRTWAGGGRMGRGWEGDGVGKEVKTRSRSSLQPQVHAWFHPPALAAKAPPIPAPWAPAR